MNIMVDLTSLVGVRPLPTLNRRFWNKVDASGECWIYTGSRNANGYGLFVIPVLSSRGPSHRTESVHRLLCEAVNGPIPPGLEVLHLCDRPPCVNPAHLRVGTTVENMADKMARDRHPRGGRVPGISLPHETFTRRYGERHCNAKLSDAQVCEMRHRYAADRRLTTADLARDYALSKTNVGRILRGDSRRDAGGPVGPIRPIVGASVRGPRQSHLTEAMVRQIRRTWGDGSTMTMRDLAHDFGATVAQISGIVRRVTWKHVTDDGPVVRYTPRRFSHLTKAQVITIRTRYAAGASGRQLAGDFQVSPAAISMVVNGISHRPTRRSVPRRESTS